MDVQDRGNMVNIQLNDYQLVVFNNWDLESMTEASKNDVEEYVPARRRPAGHRRRTQRLRRVQGQHRRSARAYAAGEMLAPRSPEGTGIILIVDKSSSMEGRKMELRSSGRYRCCSHCDPSIRWACWPSTTPLNGPCRSARPKTSPFLTRIISGIRPMAAHRLHRRSREAFAKMRWHRPPPGTSCCSPTASRREGNSVSLRPLGEEQKITISTVGHRSDVNKAYLEKVGDHWLSASRTSCSTSHQLEQILVKDVLEHTGSDDERNSTARSEVRKKVEILNDVAIEVRAALLKGYVRFIAKPSAETIFKVDREDPALPRWQYGLGRAAVFASDAKSRWAMDWIKWKGFVQVLDQRRARSAAAYARMAKRRWNTIARMVNWLRTIDLGRGMREEPAAIPAIFRVRFGRLSSADAGEEGRGEGLPQGRLEDRCSRRKHIPRTACEGIEGVSGSGALSA